MTMIPDILKLAGFGAAFILLSGCTERLSGPDGGRPEGRIIITLSPDSGREVTVKDIAGIDETSINNLYAIQFDRNGAVLSNEYFSSDNEKFNTADNTVEVSVGEETDGICFIANAGSGAIGGVSTLADLGLKCKSLTNGEASLTNDNRTVMSGVWHSGDPDFTVEMYRAIAKVDFTLLAGAGVEFALHSIRMCNVPKVMYYHRDQDRLLPSETVAAYPEINSTDDLADYTEQQVASASDRLTAIEGWTDLRYMTEGTTPHTGKLLDGTDGYSCLYYLPENARGTGSATDQRQKSAETAPAGQEEYCTYIEIKGYYKSDNLVTLTEYRIFLGENNTDDYNILRNSNYKVTATILGPDRIDTRINDMDPQNYLDYTDNSSPWIVFAAGNDATSEWSAQITDAVTQAGWETAAKEHMMLGWIYLSNDNSNFTGNTSWAGEPVNGTVSGRWFVNLGSGITKFLSSQDVGSNQYPIWAVKRMQKGFVYPYVEDGNGQSNTIVSRDGYGGVRPEYVRDVNTDPWNYEDNYNHTEISAANKVASKFEVASAEIMSGIVSPDYNGSYRDTWDEAKEKCHSLGNDWRMPTQRELMLMYVMRNQIKDKLRMEQFDTDIPGEGDNGNHIFYWSSTQSNSAVGDVPGSQYGWSVCFCQSGSDGEDHSMISGKTEQYSKTAHNYFRCVRDVKDQGSGPGM